MVTVTRAQSVRVIVSPKHRIPPFHLRPYHLEGILDEIKTVPEETILVFNDQNEVMVADYGTD